MRNRGVTASQSLPTHGRYEIHFARMLRSLSKISFWKFGVVASACILQDFNYSSETQGLGDSQVSEHFSIQGYVRAIKVIDERRVRESIHSGGRIDPKNPQGAHLSTLHLPISVRILPRLHHSMLGHRVYAIGSTEKSLCELYDFLVSMICHRSGLDQVKRGKR